MNQYPLWKYLLLACVLVIGVIYALPNLYGEDPALQISGSRNATMDSAAMNTAVSALKTADIPIKSTELKPGQLLIRFNDTEAQIKAVDFVKSALGTDYTVALNLAPATPAWLSKLNALPMYLGLDLRGGVHFLMEVDMKAAIEQAIERYSNDIRTLLRDARIRYAMIRAEEQGVRIMFRSESDREQSRKLLESELPSLEIDDIESENPGLLAKLSEQEIRDLEKNALQQNILTLRNRVNELGVAEPVIVQQGSQRIVVQLPGVQDTVEAKRILGATATLEYRAVDYEHDVQKAVAGTVPAGSRLYKDRDGNPVLLKQAVIVTGDQIVNASSGIDQQSGGPQVSVMLDAKGARSMLNFTKKNVGKPMAVVFIENRTETKLVDGIPVKSNKKVEEVISVATIRDVFSKRFQTTGLDSPQEAHELALLLRSGALAAPINIVEERTIGPSLGKDNIAQGFKSVVIGFLGVLVFMALYYRVFGLVADMALALNLVLIVAILSLLQATLTMPGIAGIVLTVGMAVDANVLIFERIREELRNGNSPQASIHAGYEKALSTIADANITTLIAAVVLLSYGTGAVKGFAVTLAIGIVTSMFTAIMGTRAVINLIYGGRRLARLSI
ncbi:MAG: protein translocase subunit SecD [Gammaproteobacteria bacterium]|jgi:preprotein translocase subunit SecD|nr:protein translocase subunit SecD [Gammaproteobacteria bacterium]